MTSKVPAYTLITDLEERCQVQEQLITMLREAAQHTLAAIGETNSSENLITAPRWIQAHLGECRKALAAAIKATAPTVAA